MGRKNLRILFALTAIRDLEDLVLYYEEQGVPKIGRRLAVEIIGKIERLVRYPASGRIVPEFGAEYLREVIHPPFRIVYRLETGSIAVVRIWRSERALKIDD